LSSILIYCNFLIIYKFVEGVDIVWVVVGVVVMIVVEDDVVVVEIGKILNLGIFLPKELSMFERIFFKSSLILLNEFNNCNINTLLKQYI